MLSRLMRFRKCGESDWRPPRLFSLHQGCEKGDSAFLAFKPLDDQDETPLSGQDSRFPLAGYVVSMPVESGGFFVFALQVRVCNVFTLAGYSMKGVVGPLKACMVDSISVRIFSHPSPLFLVRK